MLIVGGVLFLLFVAYSIRCIVRGDGVGYNCEECDR